MRTLFEFDLIATIAITNLHKPIAIPTVSFEYSLYNSCWFFNYWQTLDQTLGLTTNMRNFRRHFDKVILFYLLGSLRGKTAYIEWN